MNHHVQGGPGAAQGHGHHCVTGGQVHGRHGAVQDQGVASGGGQLGQCDTK